MFLFLSLVGVSTAALGSNSQHDGGSLVCSYTKPQDMSHVEVLYSHDNGVLRERYCTTKATPQLLASSGAPMLQDTNSCTNPALPYLPGSGYNIMIGMPLPTMENAVDPGYLDAPVFERTWDDCVKTEVQESSGYKTWTVPDGYANNLNVYLTAGSSSSTIYDQKSFQKQAKSSLSVSGGGKAFGVEMEFTAGAEWSSATSSLSEGETVQQRYTREAGAYTTQVVPATSKLSDAYLQTLTTAFMVDNWSLFFLSYGTHVTTEVKLGARYSQVTEFERQKFEELKSNEAAYNAGIKASYDGATGAVDTSHSHSETDKSMVESSSKTQFIVSNGGDGAALNAKDSQSMKEYQEAAHNFPSPLRSSMTPHDILITVSKWSEFKEALAKYYPDNAKAKSVTTADFEAAWVTATEVYCGDDAHKCTSVSSYGAPEPMTLTYMHFDSKVWGEWQPGNVVSWPSMPKFQTDYKPTIKISAIRTYCSRLSDGRSRFRGLQFEYFDGDRSAATDVLGTKPNANSDDEKKWESTDNLLAYGEFVSGVTVSSGADVDGIWFIVQNEKDQKTRKIGCGYSSNNMQTWSIPSGQRLLAFSGTGIDMDGDTIVKQIQFRTYLYILPTLTASGKPNCHCVTPNQGKDNLNGAACTNGDFLWCSANQYCINGKNFPKSTFDTQCSDVKYGVLLNSFQATPPAPATKEQQAHSSQSFVATPPSSATPAPSHHKVLLQQIEKLQASKKAKESNEAASKKHSVWKEAKHGLKEMSKKVKEEVKEELKELILKEMKTALGDLHNKQAQLEDTVTRMLVHQIESF